MKSTKHLIPILADTLHEYENVQIINEDVLKLDIAKMRRGSRTEENRLKWLRIFHIILRHRSLWDFLKIMFRFRSITVMVQKEVADRMQTGPGNKDYGALSLAVQYYADPYIVANVPPNCFMPRPKVGSAVIRLTRHAEPPVEVEDEKLMFDIIRASFNQRRKTLANGLKNAGKWDLPKEVIAEAIETLGKGASVRGEALSLEEFARLSNEIYNYLHNRIS